MIANETTIQTLSRSSTGYALQFSRGRVWVAMPAAVARRVTGAVVSFAKLPLLPAASLWEAAVVVSLVNGADRVDAEALPRQTSVRADDRFAWRF